MPSEEKITTVIYREIIRLIGHIFGSLTIFFALAAISIAVKYSVQLILSDRKDALFSNMLSQLSEFLLAMDLILFAIILLFGIVRFIRKIREARQ